MPFFQYKAVTPDGRVTEGTLEASDKSVAIARLEEQGQMPIKVSAEGEAGLFGSEFKLPWQRKRVPQSDLLLYTQELATLMKAGLPLDRSLTILADLTDNVYLKEIGEDLLREIKGGKSLSEGLAMYPQVFPKLYINMVRAGEISGTLDSILLRVVDYLENVEELRNYFISSLIYPAILGFVGTGSIIVMVTFVIPKFAGIFENAGAPIPLPMKIMLGISGILTSYWWLILLAIAGAVYMWKRYIQSEEGRLSWDRRILSFPLLGSLMRKIEVGRFSRTLGTLLKSAVPLIQSINIVREVVNNQVIAQSMEGVVKGVKKGDGLARSVKRSEVFPAFAVHLLEVGEETGRLDDMLLQIADTYDREMRTAIKRLIALFEPAMILFMGLVIGLMVVSMLYSIFSINDVPL
ncbi:MAG: type II secretion system F family protein [Acidobacteriota bacterium]|nr:MAG: type II secretion system F family protein [Acidobacteriota bacterium]